MSEPAPKQEQAPSSQDGNAPAPTAAPDHSAEFARYAQAQARMERENRQLSEQLRVLKEQQGKLEGTATKYRELEEAIQNRDYDTLASKHGLSYKDWTDHEVDKPSPEAQQITALKRELGELQKWKESESEAQAKLKEQAKRAEDEKAQSDALKYIQDEVVGTAEGESLSYVRALGAHSEILDRYRQLVREYGSVPDSETASRFEKESAAAAEKEAETSLRAQLTELLKVGKFRALVQELQETEAQQDSQGQGSLQDTDLSGSVPQSAKRELPAEERRKLAIQRTQEAIDRQKAERGGL